MANRADGLRDAFHQEHHAIAGLPADQRGAWGIGFYQGDEVLHKKQPAPGGEPIYWERIAENLKTDCAVAHLRQATVGGFSIDNTHPFRFRQWLFAHVGTIPAFDEVRAAVLGELPDYLTRNLRGTSDSEVFFHLVLAKLHAAGQLDAFPPSDGAVLDALRAGVETVDRLVGTGRGPSTLNVILCNGRAMYALRRGAAFGYVERTGRHDPEHADEQPRPGSPLLHYVMLVAGALEVPADYTALEEGQVAIVNRDPAVTLTSL